MIAAGKVFKGYIRAALPRRFLFWGCPPSPLPLSSFLPFRTLFLSPPSTPQTPPQLILIFSVPTPRTAKWEVSEIFFVPKIISFIMVICGILPSLSLCNLRYYFINENCEIWGSSALEAGVCNMLQRLQFYTRIPSSNIFPSYILYTYTRGHKNVHICVFYMFYMLPFYTSAPYKCSLLLSVFSLCPNGGLSFSGFFYYLNI